MQDLGESLREICCAGDVGKAKVLIEHGVDVNSQNKVNGWTALHWASRRNHEHVVSLLLANGADPSIRTFKGEAALDLTQYLSIRRLISGNSTEDVLDEGVSSVTDDSLNIPANGYAEFVPNYMLNPEFPYKESASEFARRLGIKERSHKTMNTSSNGFNTSHILSSCNDNQKDTLVQPEGQNYNDLVLKFRVACAEDPDFIELELDRNCLTFDALVETCLKEFSIEENKLKKIRKLPNTIVRNDRDVKRLKQFQEMEIVIE